MITGLQLLNEIEERLGYRQSSTIEGEVSSGTRKLVRLFNRILKTMSLLEQWPMLRQEGTLITEAAVQESLLLDMTNGSTVVDISAFDASGFTFEQKHAYWAVQFGTSSTPIYRVAKVVSPTRIELNRVWIGSTVTVASVDDDTTTMVLAMDQYALPEDFDRPDGEWEDFLSDYAVVPLSADKFKTERRKQGAVIVTDKPRVFTVYGLDPSETYQVIHFNPWPVEQTMLQYSYLRVHPAIEQDTDKVLFPPAQHSMLIEAVLTFANRDYEDDQRSQAAMLEFMMQFRSVGAQNSVVSNEKNLSPWTGYRARAPLSRAGGGVRYDYGTHFDVAGNIKLP